MKWIGILLILAGSTGIGLYKSAIVKYQYDNLKEMKKSLICLRGEIMFGRVPLPEAFGSVSRRTKGVISTFYKIMAEKLIQGNGQLLADLWKEEASSCMSKSALKENDIREWMELGQTIGYLDSDMQIQTINLYVERIQQSLELQGEEQKVKIRLYNLLGVMGGLFITIIIM